jgi:hypothetical protein
MCRGKTTGQDRIDHGTRAMHSLEKTGIRVRFKACFRIRFRAVLVSTAATFTDSPNAGAEAAALRSGQAMHSSRYQDIF